MQASSDVGNVLGHATQPVAQAPTLAAGCWAPREPRCKPTTSKKSLGVPGRVVEMSKRAAVCGGGAGTVSTSSHTQSVSSCKSKVRARVHAQCKIRPVQSNPCQEGPTCVHNTALAFLHTMHMAPLKMHNMHPPAGLIIGSAHPFIKRVIFEFKVVLLPTNGTRA